MDTDSERALLQKVVAGNRQAFGELVRFWYPSLLRMALSLCRSRDKADDLVQETFLKVHSSLGNFDCRRPFRPWVFRILLNTFRTELRRSQRLVPTDFPSDLLRNDPESGPLERLLVGEKGRRFLQALDALPGRWRETLILRGASGMSYREIAEATGVGVGTVMSRLHRGRRRLMKLLQGVWP